MVRSTIVAVLSLLLFASAAHADETPASSIAPVPGIRASIQQARFDVPIDYRPHLPPFFLGSATRHGGDFKILTAALLGVGGSFAGAAVGSPFTQKCSFDDPGLKGMMIGAPIGGITGAIAAVLAMK
jgi:hypothetical protein